MKRVRLFVSIDPMLGAWLNSKARGLGWTRNKLILHVLNLHRERYQGKPIPKEWDETSPSFRYGPRTRGKIRGHRGCAQAIAF